MPRWILGLALLVGGGLAGAAVTAGLAGPLVTLDEPEGDDGSAEAPEDPLEARGWTYLAIPHVAGTGRGGLPVLPLDTSDEGWLEGEPTMTTRIDGHGFPEVTVDVRPWYTYCGHDEAPGLQPNWTGDEALRYHDAYQGWTVDGETPEPWYANRTGEPVDPDEVPPGKPFYATWRTPPDADGSELLVFGLLKRNASAVPHAPYGLPVTEDRILAWFVYSTHYCTTTRTQPMPVEGRFGRTTVEDPARPWLDGVPHPIRDSAHSGVWDPNRLVVDQWTGSAWPEAGGESTTIPPLGS